MRLAVFACDWCGVEAKGTDITRRPGTRGSYLPARWSRLSIPATTPGVLLDQINHEMGLVDMDTCADCANTRVALALGGLISVTPT